MRTPSGRLALPLRPRSDDVLSRYLERVWVALRPMPGQVRARLLDEIATGIDSLHDVEQLHGGWTLDALLARVGEPDEVARKAIGAAGGAPCHRRPRFWLRVAARGAAIAAMALCAGLLLHPHVEVDAVNASWPALDSWTAGHLLQRATIETLDGRVAVLTCHQPTVSGRACPGGDQPVAEVVPYGGESARVIATRLGGIPVSVDEQSTKRDLEDAWVAVAVLAVISSAGAVAALLAAGLTVVLFTERLSRRPGLARAEM